MPCPTQRLPSPLDSGRPIPLRSRFKALAISGIFALLTCAVSAQTAPSPAAAESAGASQEPFRFELLQTSYVFDADGRGAQTIEARISVLAPAAIQQLGQLYFSYANDISSLDVDFVRVIKADGRELEASEELFKDLPAPIAETFPIYSAQRILHVTAPPFEVGDQLHYRVATRFTESLTPGSIGMLHQFQRSVTTAKESLIVDVPAAVKTRFRAGEGFTPVIETTDDRRIYSWEVELSEAAAEITELEALNLSSDIELSSVDSWSDVGTWYRSISEGPGEVSEAIRTLAEERLAGLEDIREKVAVLHQLVTTEIRYLAVHIGAGRYRPRSADEVLSSGHGDCKGKHALLSALLAAAGIDSSPVLVGVTRNAPLDIPTILHFDHVITLVHLDDGKLWLDSTQIAPAGFLTYELRGREGLLIPAEEEPKLVELPKTLPFDQWVSFEATAKIDEQGELTSRNIVELRGDSEVFMRTLMLSMPPEHWPQLATAYEMAIQLDGEMTDAELSDPMAIDEPARIEFTKSLENALRAGSEKVQLEVPLPPIVFGDLPTIKMPGNDEEKLDLRALPRAYLRLQLEVEGALEVEEMAPISLDYDHFTFRSEFSATPTESGVRLEIEKSMAATSPTLAVDKVNEYEAFKRAIRKEEKRQIKLRLKEALADSASLREIQQAANHAVRQKDWAKAEELGRRLTELQPDKPKSWALLALSLDRNGEDREALEARKKVVELDRFYDGAYFNLGLAHWAVDEDDEAIDAFRQQLKIDPLHTKTRANLGRLLGKHGGECEEIVPLLQGHGKSTHAYNWILAYLGACLHELGRIEEAQEAFEKLIASGHIAALDSAAYALVDRDVRADALPLLQSLAELDPGHGMAKNTIGWILHQAGDHSAAEAAYREQIRIVPDHSIAWYNLSQLFFEAGDVEAASGILEEFIQALEKHAKGEGTPEAYRALGLAYFDTPDAGRAREPLEKAYASFADDPVVNRTLGILAARESLFEDALRYLEKAQSLAPDSFADQDMIDYVRSELAKP